jgi:hypothetical protein
MYEKRFRVHGSGFKVKKFGDQVPVVWFKSSAIKGS